MAFLALCFVIILSSLPVLAKQTEPGQRTIWDDIMAGQAVREMQSGSQAMEEHRYEKAIQEFARAVIKQPNEPSTHMMLGTAYYWSGQVDQAETEFREALRLDPKSDQAHLLMGIAQAWKGDSQAAYKSFSEAEALNHDRPDIQMDLGSVEESLNMFPQALDHFRKAVALEPANALYHFQLGMLYSRLGRDSDAIDSLNLALKNYPEFEDAMLELGAALERVGRRQDAMEMFQKAVRIKPRDSVARLRLAREHLLLNNTQRARETFHDAFHLTPDEAGGGLALSVSFGGKPKTATAEASSPDQNQPNRPPPQSDASQDPLDVLARNLERIPLNQDSKLSIEMAFLPRPKLEPAKPHDLNSNLKRALEEKGKPPGRSNPVGIKREFTLPASDMAGRQAAIKKLLDDLRAAMRQAPQDAEVRMSMNLAFTKKQAESGPSTADSEEPKVSFQPRQVGNDLGLWVQGTGWMALVEEVLPEPGEEPIHPQTPEWWIADGLGFAALGNGELALAAFSRALQLDPKDETALLGRGVALVETGREQEAIVAYRHLLSIYPKNRTAKEGLDWLMRDLVSTSPHAAASKSKP